MSNFQIDKRAYSGPPRGVRSSWPDNILPPSAWPKSKLKKAFWNAPRRRKSGASPRKPLVDRALEALAKLAKQ